MGKKIKQNVVKCCFLQLYFRLFWRTAAEVNQYLAYLHLFEFSEYSLEGLVSAYTSRLLYILMCCYLSTSTSARERRSACVGRMLEINSTPIQIIRNITHFLHLMNSLPFCALTILSTSLHCVVPPLQCTHPRNRLYGVARLRNKLVHRRFQSTHWWERFWQVNKFP